MVVVLGDNLNLYNLEKVSACIAGHIANLALISDIKISVTDHFFLVAWNVATTAAFCC